MFSFRTPTDETTIGLLTSHRQFHRLSKVTPDAIFQRLPSNAENMAPIWHISLVGSGSV
jgi:hypothetical protein